MSKGRQIYIEGRIQNRSYDDKEGNKKYISEVVVQNFQFIGSRGDSDSPRSSQSEAPPPPPPGADSNSDDDDLPF
jgi:single-strand DNA-binding protein